MLHPARYAELLAEKMRKHSAAAWLVNTGWSGGACGTGNRMSLEYTRAIIDAIHNGQLALAATETVPVFGLAVPAECAGVPAEILVPKNTWADKGAFDATAGKLAGLFVENFKKYANDASDDVKAAGPKVVVTTA